MAKSIMHRPVSRGFEYSGTINCIDQYCGPCPWLSNQFCCLLARSLSNTHLPKTPIERSANKIALRMGEWSPSQRNPHFKYIMGWFFECMNSIHATLYLRAAQLSTNLAMVSTCCIWHFGKALKADTLSCHG